jgi:tRNA pseudouridine38-40 synthase
VNLFEVEREGDIVRIRIAAEGFIHRMVRITVGTLIEIATGRKDDSIAAILESKDRRRAGYTAPPEGLFLCGVRYVDFETYARPALAYVAR